MNKKHHLISAWCGVAYVVFFGIGWSVVAGFVPPPSPAASALDIAAFYQAHPTRILVGLTIVMLSIAPLALYMAAMTIQMARIEGRYPVLAVGNIILGTINTIFLMIATIMWMTAAFRPEQDPNVLLVLNDIGWMFMLWPFSTATLQNWLFAFCVLSDKCAKPIFPRWVGHFNFWVGVMFFPGALLAFYKVGPFAWNGLPFYVPATAYLGWIIVESVLLIKAIKLQDNTELLPAR